MQNWTDNDSFPKPQAVDQAARQLFVGGLSKKANEQNMAEFFSILGKVTDCRIVLDEATQQSKGFGFVTFADPVSVALIRQMKDLKFLGKKITVEPTESKETRDKRDLEEADRKVFVVELAHTTSKKDLERYFGKFGIIEKVEAHTHKGIAFILFKDRISAIGAVQFGGTHSIKGKTIEVRHFDQSRLKSVKAKSIQGGQGSDNSSVRSYHGSQLDGGGAFRASQGSRDRSSHSHHKSPSRPEMRPRNSIQVSDLLKSLQVDPTSFKDMPFGSSHYTLPLILEPGPSEQGSLISRPHPKSAIGNGERAENRNNFEMNKFVSRLWDDDEIEPEEIKSKLHPHSDGYYDMTSTQVSGWEPAKPTLRSSLDPGFSNVDRPVKQDGKVTSMFNPGRDKHQVQRPEDSLLNHWARHSELQGPIQPRNNSPEFFKSIFTDTTQSLIKNPHK